MALHTTQRHTCMNTERQKESDIVSQIREIHAGNERQRSRNDTYIKTKQPQMVRNSYWDRKMYIQPQKQTADTQSVNDKVM